MDLNEKYEEISKRLQKRNLELSVLSDLVNVIKIIDSVEDISSFIFDTINILGIMKSMFIKIQPNEHKVEILNSFNVDCFDDIKLYLLEFLNEFIYLNKESESYIKEFKPHEKDFFYDTLEETNYNYVISLPVSKKVSYYLILKAYDKNFFLNKANTKIFDIMANYIYIRIMNLNQKNEILNMRKVSHKNFYDLWFEKISHHKKYFERYKVPFTVLNCSLVIPKCNNFFKLADDYIDFFDQFFYYAENHIRNIDFIIKTKFNQFSLILPGVTSESKQIKEMEYKKMFMNFLDKFNKYQEIKDLVKINIFSNTYPTDTKSMIKLIEKKDN